MDTVESLNFSGSAFANKLDRNFCVACERAAALLARAAFAVATVVCHTATPVVETSAATASVDAATAARCRATNLVVRYHALSGRAAIGC